MNNINEWRIITGYIYRLRFYIGVLLLFSAVFGLFSWLCGMSADNVLYALLLICVMLSVCVIIGYMSFRKQHLYLESLMARIAFSTEKIDTYHGGLLEEDYLNLIQTIREEMAKAISESDRKASEMEEYYSMWAHQIKTPIAAMRLLLQTDNHSGRAELENELFRVEQYVEMVMQYIRSDSTSGDYIIADCDIDSVIKQAVRKYAASFIRKKIALRYDELHKSALTDEKWLCFAVEQIISNALKYTREGSVSITMEGDTLAISDTGIGIRAEDLPRVFENGYTGYNGRQDKKSTGIGLYLTARILKKLGHTISVTSVLGKGTAVYIGLARERIDIE